MMSYAHRYVARFTLEAVTPLSIGTGFGAGLFDTDLVRDANGLPIIPGTALAGVLSSLYRLYVPEPEPREEWRRLFGYEEDYSEKEHAAKGQASQLEFSFGCIHNQKDCAVDGLVLDPQGLLDDDLLAIALRDAPLKRDHVKINHRGVADGKQKFDRVSLPPGFRFSFEAAMWGGADDKSKFLEVLGLLNAPEFRLGGATHRGLGKLRLVEDGESSPRLFYRSFDLNIEEGRNAFTAYRKLAAIDDKPGKLVAEGKQYAGFTREILPKFAYGRGERRAIQIRLKLKPVDLWRFGGGNIQLTAKANRDDKGADDLPLTEVRVAYAGGQGKVLAEKGRRLAIPGSAIKGPLVHRAEFHLNCKNGRFAETLNAKDFEVRGMDKIFGSAKTRIAKTEEQVELPTGMAGLVFIDDAYAELTPSGPKSMLITHNTIDRFSGGVMNQRLFTEEVLYGGEIIVDLTVLTARPTKTPKEDEGNEQSARARWETVEEVYWQALDQALADLCEGRLALGADGHGYFELAENQETPRLCALTGGEHDQSAS